MDCAVTTHYNENIQIDEPKGGIDMIWEQLLSTQKLKPEEEEPRQFQDYPINDFEKDFSKIVSSAVFRRLQDKTQVFPLDKSFYSHPAHPFH